MYEWALFTHLAGAISFFAGLAVAAVGQTAARRRSRPSEIAALLGTARWGVVLVATGLLLALGSGFWLLELTFYGFDTWVVAALALLASSVVAGVWAARRRSGRGGSRSAWRRRTTHRHVSSRRSCTTASPLR